MGLNIVHLNYIGNLLQIQFQKAFQKDFWKCVLISTELGCFRKLFSKVSQKVFQTRKGFRKSIELGLREPNKPSFSLGQDLESISLRSIPTEEDLLSQDNCSLAGTHNFSVILTVISCSLFLSYWPPQAMIEQSPHSHVTSTSSFLSD